MKKFLNKLGIWATLDYPMDGYGEFKKNHPTKDVRWIGVQLRWFAVFFVVERNQRQKKYFQQLANRVDANHDSIRLAEKEWSLMIRENLLDQNNHSSPTE
jgi:hypothetical protein